MKHFEKLQDLQALVGQELGHSDWFRVDQARIDAFAQATGDHQWIHLDPVRAAQGPFGSTVAHGFLTLSLLPVIIQSTLSFGETRMSVNYGLNRVRFPAPLRSNTDIRGTISLHSYEALPDGVQLVLDVTVQTREGGKPVCVAQQVVRLYR